MLAAMHSWFTLLGPHLHDVAKQQAQVPKEYNK